MEELEEPKKKTPLNAVRSQCVTCVGNVYKDIEDCGGHGKNPFYDYCHFYPYRLGRGRPSVKTIRKFCLHCMGNSSIQIEGCTTKTCPVYPYRFGKNPAYAGRGKSAALIANRFKKGRRATP